MESQKIYLAGNGGTDTSALLASALQNRGLDPASVMAMMGNRNGGFGGDGDLFGILLLFILMGAFNGNGWGGGFGGGNNGGLPLNMLANDSSRELIMSAIQRNGLDVSQLASTLNCSIGQVTAGINALATQISTLAGQQGMSAQQIINAIQAGNMSITNQLCNCCCEINGNITRMGYENQLSICNQTNSLTTTMNQNALSLRDGATANTNAILGKLDAMQTQALYDKIDALREAKSALQSQLSNEHQTAAIQAFQAQSIAPVNAALGDLSTRLAAIECRQPPTFPMPYVPAAGSYVPVNYGVNVNPFAASAACAC
jgi:hypothetical protein